MPCWLKNEKIHEKSASDPLQMVLHTVAESARVGGDVNLNDSDTAR